ncbi:MAG: type II toxin-antitoxin system RelB/DinJ family antitoxin [Oscillospiraceae bacterium]|nr:type II toxin-antitoxin system RelB/DinJ family antitoxin [Oscillospiraceae bacterium]
MATTTFSIRLDENVKKQLDEFCSNIGITTNSIFSLFANKVVKERRIPFEISDVPPQHHEWILAQLNQREARASDPETVWYSHDEFWEKVKGL